MRYSMSVIRMAEYATLFDKGSISIAKSFMHETLCHQAYP
jgi:hypothetical protein